MPPEENVAFVTEEKAAGSAPSPSFVTPNGNVVALEVDGGEPRATTGPEKAGIAEDAPFSPSEASFSFPPPPSSLSLPQTLRPRPFCQLSCVSPHYLCTWRISY